jgi:nucleoside-diphosphate-sugar epimerase
VRVLLLGGTRFVGPFAVRELVRAGHDVVVFHRGEAEPELPAAVRHVHGDFRSFADHVERLRALAPNVVVDTVAYLDKAGQGVGHFSGVAERAVVLTSGDVYRAFARLLRSEPGRPDPIPLNEDAPLRAGPSPDLGSDIDVDNVDVERAVLASDLPVTVLRLAVVYGPGDPHNRLGSYVRRMDDQRPALVLEEPLADWRRSREYVGNVAGAILAAVVDPRAAGRIYNVAPERTLTEEEWIRAIADVVGWPGEIVRVPTMDLPEAMRASIDFRQELVMDSTRIHAELGFAPTVPLRDGLRAAIESARTTPLAPTEYVVEDAILTNRT